MSEAGRVASWWKDSVTVSISRKNSGMTVATTRSKWMCAAIMLLALVIRCHRLGEVNYWFDETFSLRLAEFPPDELIARSAQDTHPPLFFLGLKVWAAVVGQTPWMARLCSVLWSLGAVFCAFAFVREAVSTDGATQAGNGQPILAASTAALCLALSPMQLTWAHQVRMYAPVACLTILSTWLLWRAVQKPDDKRRWIGYALVELAGLYTHVTMMFVFAGHLCALVLLAARRQSANPSVPSSTVSVRGGVTMGVVGLLFAPWFLVARSQNARVQSDFWSDPFEWKLLGDALVRCFGISEAGQTDPPLGIWIGQGLIVLLLILALGRRSFDLVVASSAALPFVGLIAASILGRNILNARYFISGQTLACVAAAVIVARIPSRYLRVAAAVGLVVGQGVLAWNYFNWRQEAAQKPGIPGLIKLWEEHRNADELLIFCSPMFYTTARIHTGDSSRFRVFGDQSRYTFFVGTAIMSDHEYVSSDEIDGSEQRTIWACDFGWSARYLQPVSLSDSWTLVAETSVREFNGEFFLRRYDRLALPAREQPADATSDAVHPKE